MSQNVTIVIEVSFLFNVFVASALTLINITFFPFLVCKDHFLYFWYITGDSLFKFLILLQTIIPGKDILMFYYYYYYYYYYI